MKIAVTFLLDVSQLMGKKGQESLSGMIGRLCGHSNLLHITTLDKMLFMHYSQC